MQNLPSFAAAARPAAAGAASPRSLRDPHPGDHRPLLPASGSPLMPAPLPGQTGPAEPLRAAAAPPPPPAPPALTHSPTPPAGLRLPGAPRGCAPLRAHRHTSRAAASPRTGGVYHRPARILHFLATGQPLFLQSASCWLLPAETKGGRAGRSGGCPLPSSHPDPSRPGRVRKFKFF